MKKQKKFILGQYFTKKEIVDRLIQLVFFYKKEYEKEIKILEPSAGTRNFVKSLKEEGFENISECEIDPELTQKPSDFLLFPIKEKFDLIIGNPPFTKYNVKESYYYPGKYINKEVKPSEYIAKKLLKKEKTQIENAFILKSIQHLKDEKSSIGFVLPISFFIKGKNTEIKRVLQEKFSTIIIYQNDKNWFEEPIPCCFAVFTNLDKYKDKVILLYEDGVSIEEILDKSQLTSQELIPKSYLYKKNKNNNGVPLSNFLSEGKAKYRRSFTENNISGANITQRIKVPENKEIENYCLAVVRVGNSSVGKAGLINIKEDILNDMFYVFQFKEIFNKNKEFKEKITKIINENQQHFRNSTIRVGSKSIKKDDLLEFGITV